MFEGGGGEVVLVVGLGEGPYFVVDVGASACGVGDVGAGFSFPFDGVLSYLAAVAEEERELDVVESDVDVLAGDDCEGLDVVVVEFAVEACAFHLVVQAGLYAEVASCGEVERYAGAEVGSDLVVVVDGVP